jgi:hypothetical protein
LYIFFVEYAREIVTANGRPSGIATTTTVTAKINASMTPTYKLICNIDQKNRNICIRIKLFVVFRRW